MNSLPHLLWDWDTLGFYYRIILEKEDYFSSMISFKDRRFLRPYIPVTLCFLIKHPIF